MFDTRADLELLADEVLGEGTRPPDWTGNLDMETTTVVSDLWFDNELLATEIFGATTRPDGWIGATSYNQAVIARNVRHDLEFAADEVFGQGIRPDIWRGASALLQCNRTLLNLIDLLGQFYGLSTTTPESSFDFCRTVSAEAQDQLLNATVIAESGDVVTAQILAVRGDLERLADERLGLNSRPVGWIGNRDLLSPTLTADNFLDLETLANELLGINQRPPDWIGAITNAPTISYRNLRHDLELLSDISLGANVRPRGWQGVDPLERCDPLVQDLVFVVQSEYEIPIEVSPESANYCEQVTDTVNFAAENPPVPDVVLETENRFTAESNFAFAYLDIAATEYMGIMPGGVRFRAFYRNFGESNMMFVSNDEFALFVDRNFTTMPEEVFAALPSIEGQEPLTFCDAVWCNGPGPTPTPTGFGILVLILPTAVPPVDVDELAVEGKIQVSWNYIRVTYLADNAANRTAQVTLEICAEPAQIACEPVTRLFDNTTGQLAPVVGESGGLNVYEFRYGYTDNLVIEGASRYSPDIWISDPT
ncbi:MAG: hypothetical protein H7175_17165, partial [Burkholderiales bacterium]|nr:hypothetical protein [Anaerolineae bacterium]